MAKKKDDLEALRLPDLQAKFAEVTGKTTRSPNKKYLIRKITEAMEAGDETPEPEADDAPADEKLSKLDVPALQAKVLELTGRETKSSNKRYLIFRCQQALKGRIPVGPRRGGQAVPQKVVPARIPAAALESLDEARKRLGLKSRNDLFLRSLHAYLDGAGEHDVAALLAPEA